MNFTHQKRSFEIEGESKDDYIYNKIVNTQSFYEIDLLHYMQSYLRFSRKKNTLAIDVGANIGNHSLFMRSFLAEHLIAVEPNPTVLPALRNNLAANIDNYTVYDCAVGESDGEATIAVPRGAEDNVGMARVSFEGSGEKVRVTTLDTILDKWLGELNQPCRISVIKIDVEGMELPVLKGAEKIIAEHKPNIFAEAATDEEYEKINDHLQPLGYTKLSRWAVTPVYHFAFNPSLVETLLVRNAVWARDKRSRRKKRRKANPARSK